MRAAAIILRPVHYAQGIFYALNPKVDASLSGGTLEETGGHVSNIYHSKANKTAELLQSAFIVDYVAVALRA